jgi:hypothetical protein
MSTSLDKLNPILLPKLAVDGILAMSFSVAFFYIETV